MKFVHLDIKLENVVLNDDFSLSLIDFGTTRNMRDSFYTLSTMEGTPEYRAPENYE